MKKYILLLTGLLASILCVEAQEPLYIVNDEVRREIRTIPPDQIERIETLPADEETIALYGSQASHGVMLITLRHDRAAEFTGKGSFTDYITSRVQWDDNEPAARVILRCTITTDGQIVVDTELESTDGRLRRRVLKALEEAPAWRPATKNGMPIESRQVFHIQLPKGKALPRETELIWR